MTSEYLLNVMGLIDDDLILDAEIRHKPDLWTSAQRLANRWAPMAACLALVFTLGYGAAQLWTVGSDNAATGNAASDTNGQHAAEPERDFHGNAFSDQYQESAGSVEPTFQVGKVRLFFEEGDGVYTVAGHVGELPEGCCALGNLTFMPGSGGRPQYPAVDGEAWVGLELWAEETDSIPETLYIQQDDGWYAVAELVQP